jgi:hypothetical protein
MAIESRFETIRIRLFGGLAGDDHDDSVRTSAGAQPQEGLFALKQESQPNNDDVESFPGNEGVGIGSGKSCPIAQTGNRRAPRRGLDEVRRFVDSDHKASGTNQPGDQERCVANAAL